MAKWLMEELLYLGKCEPKYADIHAKSCHDEIIKAIKDRMPEEEDYRGNGSDYNRALKDVLKALEVE